MASSKAKVGVNMETNVVKENKSSAGSSAGETSPSANLRMYSLDELDTIATVGEAATGAASRKKDINQCHKRRSLQQIAQLDDYNRTRFCQCLPVNE